MLRTHTYVLYTSTSIYAVQEYTFDLIQDIQNESTHHVTVHILYKVYVPHTCPCSIWVNAITHLEFLIHIHSVHCRVDLKYHVDSLLLWDMISDGTCMLIEDLRQPRAQCELRKVYVYLQWLARSLCMSSLFVSLYDHIHGGKQLQIPQQLSS